MNVLQITGTFISTLNVVAGGGFTVSSISKVDSTTSEERITGKAIGSRSTRGHQQTSRVPTMPTAFSSKGKADTSDFVTAHPHVRNATGSTLLSPTKYWKVAFTRDIFTLKKIFLSSAFSSSNIQTTPNTTSVNKKELTPSNQMTTIVVIIVGVVILLIPSVVSVSFILLM